MRKLFVNVIVILFLGLMLSACSYNKMAVTRPIMPGASLGIYVYNSSLNTKWAFIRSFMIANYKVKALDTVPWQHLLPEVKRVFDNTRLPTKMNPEKIMEIYLTTDLRRHLALRDDLLMLKKNLGLDYLLFVYPWGNMIYALGIDLGTYDIVYVHYLMWPKGYSIEDVAEIFVKGIRNVDVSKMW